MLYQMLSVIIVISMANWYIMASLPIMLGISAWLFAYTIPAYKECTRIESVSKSPMINFINESCNGCSTIRAFRKQDEFIKRNNELLNRNILANQFIAGTWGWFGIRMNLLSILLMTVSTFICMYFRRTEDDKVLMAMVLSYILQLQSYVIWLLMSIGNIEQQMVSI